MKPKKSEFSVICILCVITFQFDKYAPKIHNSKINIKVCSFSEHFKINNHCTVLNLHIKWDQNLDELNTIFTSQVLFSSNQGSRQLVENKASEERTVFSSIGCWSHFSTWINVVWNSLVKSWIEDSSHYRGENTTIKWTVLWQRIWPSCRCV